MDDDDSIIFSIIMIGGTFAAMLAVVPVLIGKMLSKGMIDFTEDDPELPGKED